MNSLLSLITFLPLIGAVVLIVFLRGEDAWRRRTPSSWRSFTTNATFLVSLFVISGYEAEQSGVPVRRGASNTNRTEEQGRHGAVGVLDRRRRGSPRCPKDHPETSDSRPRQCIPPGGKGLTPEASTRASLR